MERVDFIDNDCLFCKRQVKSLNLLASGGVRGFVNDEISELYVHCSSFYDGTFSIVISAINDAILLENDSSLSEIFYVDKICTDCNAKITTFTVRGKYSCLKSIIKFVSIRLKKLMLLSDM